MTDFAQVKKNALGMARRWAKQGNTYMAQNFLDQAQAVGYVSERQILYLNKALDKAKKESRQEESN